MKHLSRFFVVCPLLVFALTVVSIHRSFGISPDAERKLNAAIRSWDSITPQMIADPANQEWVEEMRKLAIARSSPEATSLFLNLGDPEVIQSCLDAYRHTGDLGGMAFSSQPKLIVGLGEDLNRNEAAEPKHKFDAFVLPVSVRSGVIIAEIIKNSAPFREEVKSWVKSIEHLPRTQRRAFMRTWWNENKELLKAERYGEVNPPSTWDPSVLRSANPSTQKEVEAIAILPTHGPTTNTTPFFGASPSPPATAAATAPIASAAIPKWLVVAGLMALCALAALLFRLKRGR